MRKLIFTLLVLPLFTFAQTRLENNAKATVQLMTEVLSLEKADADKVYKVELDKNIKIAAIRKAGADDPSQVKPKVSAANKDYEKNMSTLIGEEKFAKWLAYQKDEKAKKAEQ